MWPKFALSMADTSYRALGYDRNQTVQCYSLSLHATSMRGDNVGHASGQPARRRQVKELVGPVSVRIRPQYARHHKLRLRKLFAQHRDEGDRAAFAEIHGFGAEPA